MPKVRAAKACADRVAAAAALRASAELGVVKQVEGFPFEVQPSSLGEDEPLGHAEVEVEPAGQVERIAADVAKSQAGRNGESRGVEQKRSEDSSSRIRSLFRTGW